MGLRDIIHKMPDTRQELSDYIIEHYSNIKDLVQKNPQYKNTLTDAVSSSFDKYSKYLGGLAGKLSSVGHVVGYTADAWFLGTGDIIGSLGGKFLNLLAQVPEKAYGLMYALDTGNYLDGLQNILEGAISYLPGLTFVDQGLTRIVQKRMVKDAVARFEKEVGIYKPWHEKLKEKLSSVYTDVKDRSENIFTPEYQPSNA